MRVVFSKDLTRTLIFGVIGELANFRGLKLSTVLRMRFVVFGLVLARIERQLMVASTSRTSLCRRLAGHVAIPCISDSDLPVVVL